MNKDSKIYIAGHRGLVGGALLRRLEQDGYKNILTRTREELDLLDQVAVRKFFEQEKPTYVINAAARVGGIKANMTYPTEFLFENLQIQNNIIWSAFESGVEKFLFLGSSCIYPRSSPQPMKEEYLLDGKVEPTNEGYALAKIAGIKLCEKIALQHGRTFISCMPTNIYGPGDNFSEESSHVIPGLMRRMHEAKVRGAPEVVIWGSGESRREFLHVDDLSDAIVWLMDNYEDAAFANVGTGVDVSIKELATLIKDVVGFKGTLVFDTTKPDGMPKKLLDVSKLKDLGWSSRTELPHGLKETYEWFKESHSHA
jgi:GDP-L-fucose synthase